MNTDKFISEFKSLNNKITTYELERNNLLSKLKSLEKENKKYIDKVKKETDIILKSLYQMKITTNDFFIGEINSIFSFNDKKDKK